jgi:hypothetical protein
VQIKNGELYDRLNATKRVQSRAADIKQTWLWNRLVERPKIRSHTNTNEIAQTILAETCESGWYMDYYLDPWFVDYFIPATSTAIILLQQNDYVWSAFKGPRKSRQNRQFAESLATDGIGCVFIEQNETMADVATKVRDAVSLM